MTIIIKNSIASDNRSGARDYAGRGKGRELRRVRRQRISDKRAFLSGM